VPAFHAAQTNRFLLGAHGTGHSVQVGGGRERAVGKPESAGQGGAFKQVGNVKIDVFTIVNALGA
jgi:6-aminohexanoate-oligomer endohydrolase